MMCSTEILSDVGLFGLVRGCCLSLRRSQSKKIGCNDRIDFSGILRFHMSAMLVHPVE